MFIAHSYPRAALIGNPSDGYFGKCIAFVFSNFEAEVKAEIDDQWSVNTAQKGLNSFANINDFTKTIAEYGYYGGNPLMLAGLKVFFTYANEKKINLPNSALRITYQSNIPTRLGLAGSSALITALFKVLIQWSGNKIEPAILANLVLSVEKDELGIGAGLQDRVAQAYETPVFMDFNRESIHNKGFGQYEAINLKAIHDKIFIAYSPKLSEGSEKTHNKFRQDFESGELRVLSAIEKWKKMTTLFKDSVSTNEIQKLLELINENFDLRNELMELKKEQVDLVMMVRMLGASAKFSGSGGAVIALAENQLDRDAIVKRLNAEGVEVIIPQIVYSQA